MNAELKENAGLPAHILWTLAIVAGISVANLYYNQPLLNLMRADLGVSDFQANLIAMITQIGCARSALHRTARRSVPQEKDYIDQFSPACLCLADYGDG